MTLDKFLQQLEPKHLHLYEIMIDSPVSRLGLLEALNKRLDTERREDFVN